MVRNTKSHAAKCFDSVLKIFADLSVLKPHRTSVGRRAHTCVDYHFSICSLAVRILRNNTDPAEAQKHAAY
jgi:hypothetical protein